MRKPSFGVTAGAVVALCLVGGFKVIYEPLLPPSPTEYLVTVPSSETLPAPIVEIDWKRTIQEGQQEAKRRKLAILIFFLDPSNYYAKQLELDVFRDPEVARFVNRSFVPVKINLDQYPEWSQAVLPLQRLGHYIEPGIELVVTDPDGRLIDHYAVESPFQFSGPEAILPFFIQAQNKLGRGASEQNLQFLQDQDLQSLAMTAVEPLPALADFNGTVKDEFRFRKPGIFEGGSTKFRPMALRFLAKSGDLHVASQVVQALALTPLYDPIDGGFFREARTSPSSVIVDTSKSSSHNALGAVVVAQLACAEHDESLRRLAMDIGNEVITEFSDGDSLCASRLNDSDIDMRSRRSSLSKNRLSAMLDAKGESLFQTFLTTSLSPDQNLSSLLNLDSLGNQDFLTLRETIREKLNYAPGLSEPDHIATVGYVAARLFDLYRYTGDKRFLNSATSFAQQVYSALGASSIARIYGSRNLGAGWLGTYLSFADCGLSNFAATGEIYPLRNGQKALQIALKTFRDPLTGLLFNTSPAANTDFQFRSAIPDLADRGRESLNAQAIRLAYGYSLTTENPKVSATLASYTQNTMVRLNSVMHKAGIVASGYYDAAFDAIRNRAVMVGGPDRIDAANALAKQYPLIPVYAYPLATGDRKTAYYIRDGFTTKGPLSEAELRKLLVPDAGTYTP